jgi:hypothetical protein
MPNLSRQRVANMLRAGDVAATAHEKGREFEALIRYAFGCVPGIQHYRSNIVNAAQSEEIDIAFFNQKSNRGFSFLDQLLLVECKNWSVPVGANMVREFTTKLEQRACSYGVLVAANGITGDPADLTSAHDAVRMALALKKIRIIVVTRAEIQNWRTASDIVELLKKKLCELTVGGTIFLI